MEAMKRCRACRRRKPLAQFYPRHARCKACYIPLQTVATRAYRKRNRSMWLARKAVERAVKRGRIVKPAKCAECPSTGRLEAHHPNYAHPLVIVWLCVMCHRRKHRTRRPRRLAA